MRSVFLSEPHNPKLCKMIHDRLSALSPYLRLLGWNVLVENYPATGFKVWSWLETRMLLHITLSVPKIKIAHNVMTTRALEFHDLAFRSRNCGSGFGG